MTDPPDKPAPTLAALPALAARPRPGGPSPALEASGRKAAQAYAELALARMAEMISDPDPKIALAACREILDRAWGKAEAASRASDEEAVIVVVREGEDA